MIYWTDVAASHRLSTLKTAEEEEDIWVGAFDLHPVAFMYTSRPSGRHESVIEGGHGRRTGPLYVRRTPVA
jgi:hypothetical protein